MDAATWNLPCAQVTPISQMESMYGTIVEGRSWDDQI
jgi:hypothetical protein